MMQVLLHDHRKRYELLAWVIMPNHVHVVLEPIAPNSLSRIVKALKGVSSKSIGKLLGQRGQLWQIDYFDRRVRDDEHYKRLVRYIEWNPVKGGIVRRAQSLVLVFGASRPGAGGWMRTRGPRTFSGRDVRAPILRQWKRRYSPRVEPSAS